MRGAKLVFFFFFKGWAKIIYGEGINYEIYLNVSEISIN